MNIKAKNATSEGCDERHAIVVHGKQEVKKEIVLNFGMCTAQCQAKNEDDNVMVNVQYEFKTASTSIGGPP